MQRFGFAGPGLKIFIFYLMWCPFVRGSCNVSYVTSGPFGITF